MISSREAKRPQANCLRDPAVCTAAERSARGSVEKCSWEELKELSCDHDLRRERYSPESSMSSSHAERAILSATGAFPVAMYVSKTEFLQISQRPMPKRRKPSIPDVKEVAAKQSRILKIPVKRERPACLRVQYQRNTM